MGGLVRSMEPMARSVQEGGPATWIEDLQLFINGKVQSERQIRTLHELAAGAALAKLAAPQDPPAGFVESA